MAEAQAQAQAEARVQRKHHFTKLSTGCSFSFRFLWSKVLGGFHVIISEHICFAAFLEICDVLATFASTTLTYCMTIWREYLRILRLRFLAQVGWFLRFAVEFVNFILGNLIKFCWQSGDFQRMLQIFIDLLSNVIKIFKNCCECFKSCWSCFSNH